MIKVGVGQSRNDDSFKAGEEAAKDAVGDMGEKPTLSLIFSSARFDLNEMLKGVRSVIKGSVIGCSTAGELTGEGVANGSVAVMSISSDDIKVGLGVGEDISKNPRYAGQMATSSAIGALGEDLRAGSHIFIKTKSGKFANISPHSMLILPDALSGGGADVVRGITDVVGLHFPVAGGSPGDDLQMKKTYEFCNDSIYSDSIVSALLTSDLATGIGVRHGWHPVGRSMIVNRSEGGRVYSIDGKPAIKCYEEFFSREIQEEALGREFTKHSLGIPACEGEYRLRWPIIKKEDGSLICAAEIPEDSVVRIMSGDEDSAIKAAEESARDAMINAGEPEEVAACIVFDCISRRQLLGEHANKQIEAIRGVVGRDTPLIGFETYGEQAPTFGGPVGFHNQTIVIYVISKTTQGELVARSL